MKSIKIFLLINQFREKTAAIIRAEGEAEAARLINEAVKNFGSGNTHN